MKTKIFLITLALAAIATSCTNDEPKAFVIKDTDKIAIRASNIATKAPGVIVATNTEHLSALEIVKQTTIINTPLFGRSFAKEQRDTVSATPKLFMWATDVISLDGELQDEWIEATDVVFVRYLNGNYQTTDTIAYIPNATLRTAETAIRAAYAAKDIDACYTVFNTAYTFMPITGAEWRALKASGQN